MVESADNVSDTPAPVWLRRQLEIVNAYGLHMRPSTRFVTLARSFRAEVFVVVEDRRANGKSILDMTSLAATRGTEIIVEACGDDAESALEALAVLVSAGFHMAEEEA